MKEHQSALDTPEYKLTKIAIHAARAYYDKETFDHAKRVADYISDNEAIPIDIRNECWCVAMMHDLLEDTDYEPYELYPDYECAYKAFQQILSLLQGNKIAQPMKYISNTFLAIILALLVNYFVVKIMSVARKPSEKQLLEATKNGFRFENPEVTFTHETKRYDPPSSSSSGGGGGGGGGHSGGGGGGHSF